MEETEKKRPEKSSKLSTPQPLKRMMIPQLLLSVSIFSFVFSYSSLFRSQKSHYFSPNYNFQPLDKNCIFLICNGILILLAKTSGFIRPPPGDNLDDMLKGIHDGLQTAVEPPIEKHVLGESDGPKKTKGNECMSVGGTAKEVSIFITDTDSHDHEGGGGACEIRKWWPVDDFHAEQLYGQEEEETDELLSTEELNQKFEDFIKRMKEDIFMVNQQKQLVLLN